MRSLPELPDESQWASFLRNHDELTLDKLTDAERAEVFEAFGPDPDMQIFGRGLRRRLPPMLDGDRRRIELAYSLMFSLPGTPTLFYGEEIGMGENLDIDGRLAVRTPMQWTSGPAAGFTSAPADALRRPVPDGDFGPDQVNVADQETDPDSLLNWFRRLIRTRRGCPEIGHGEVEFVHVGDPAVVAAIARWDTGTVATVHHLAGRKVKVDLELPDGIECAHDLLRSGGLKVAEGTLRLDLAAYDHRWLRLT